MQSIVRTPSDIANELIASSSVKIEEENHREQSVEEIASRIKRLYFSKELVPVICEDMYEYKNTSTGNRQSLHSYIMEKIIEIKTSKKGHPLSIKNEQELLDILSEGYYGTQLLEEKLGEELYDDIISLVTDERSEICEGVCLKEEVEAFLRAGDFPLIITTNCFNILESRLHNLNYKPVYHELDKKDPELPSKCIYHLFGEAKSFDWGYNEKNVLRLLRSINSNAFSLEELRTYIEGPKRKTLLFLGNDTPDWLFRFILASIYGQDVYDDGKGYYLKDQSRKEIVSLNLFLHNIHFIKESQLIEVLKAVTPSIDHKTIQSKGHNKKYDFFISHASDDSDKVKALIDWLNNNNIIPANRIWADVGQSNMIHDGKYWHTIVEGIKDSAFFMPFITEHYLKKIAQKDDLEAILKKKNIPTLTLDANEALELDGDGLLKPVHIELLLASRYFKENHQENDTYSIPVFVEGREYSGRVINEQDLKIMGGTSFLPQNLFNGVKAHGYDGKNPKSLDLKWDRYKSEEELDHGKK